jgi:uncharacterized membrane protein
MIATLLFHTFLVGACAAIAVYIVRDELRWRDGR